MKVETRTAETLTSEFEPIGRAGEFASLRELIAAARDGSGCVVLLEGEAGIGKSHLLDAAAHTARHAGFSTFQGRAEEFEFGRPFGPVIDAFELRSPNPPVAARHLRQLVFADGPATGADAQHFRFQVVDSIVDTVEQLSQDDPVALVLDDLQWADPTTLLAVGSLARRVRTLPVIVLGATRPFELTSDLARLVDRLVGDGHDHVELRGLDEQAVVDITTQLLGAPPGPRLLGQATRVGGNPFFLIQLLSSLEEEGELTRADGQAEYVGEALPRQLQATVARRLSRLSNDAHQVLRVGAVIGPTFSIDPVADVLNTSVLDLIETVQELVSLGMLVDDDRTLTFRHDLLRSAVYEAVPSSARAGLHRAVGSALATSGAPTLVVAEHFLEAAQRGDTLAAEWARRAARELLAADADAAVGVLDRALALCGGVTVGTSAIAAIEVERALALVWTGRVAEAETALRAVRGHLDDTELEIQVLTELAQVLFDQARWTELIAELEPVVGHDLVAGAQGMRMRARLAAAYGVASDAERSRDLAQSVLADTAGDGDPVSRCDAFMALAWSSLGRDPAALAVEHAEAAVAEAARDGTWEAYRRHPHTVLAAALRRADRLDDALTSLEEGRRVSDDLMSSWDDSLYFAYSAIVLFNLGRWDDAEAEIDAGLERCEINGARVATPLLLQVQMAIAIRRGDLERAAQCLAQGGVTNDERPSIGATQLLRQWGMLLAAEGDREAALEKLAEAWQLDETGGWMFVAHDLITVARQLGADEWGPTVVDRLAALADTAGSRLATGIHLQCRGVVRSDPDDLLAAAEHFRSIGLRPQLAEVCADAGRLLADVDPDRARAVLQEAETIWSELGVDAAQTEVQRVVDSVGAPARRPVESRPVTGWESLTKSERRVARCVARGLTNAEVGRELFISPRTVESHLGRVFSKLQIKSRVELAIMAHEHDDV